MLLCLIGGSVFCRKVVVVNSGVKRLLAVWYPAYRWHELYSGSFMEQGNLNVSCKEKRTKTRRASLKVSILHLGADEVVVVMKLL